MGPGNKQPRKWTTPKTFLPFIITLFSPYLVFWWLLPFFSEIGPGRDFIWTVLAQMEIFLGIKNGTFPLCIPHNLGNIQSSLVAFCGLTYLPLSWLAAILPGYWQGNAVEWNLVLHLLTIGIAHLMLYYFLRKLGNPVALSLFLSILTVYPPRMVMVIFYGMAIQSWASHLFLCSAIGLYYLKPTPYKGPLSIIAGSYWLFNSGHPEEIIFTVLGTALFTIFFPFILPTFKTEADRNIRQIFRFWKKIGIFGLLASLLSSASLLPLAFDVRKELAASLQSYQWSLYQQATPGDLLHTFLPPLRVTSLKGFSATAVYLVVLFIPFWGMLGKKGVPRIIWIIWGGLILALFYALGDSTPLHYLIWEYLPFFSSIRMPTRVFSLLPIHFLLLLLWIFQADHSKHFSLSGRCFHIPKQTLLSFVATTGLILIFLFSSPLHCSEYLPPLAKLNLETLPLWTEPFLLGTNLVMLLLIGVYGLWASWRKWFSRLLFLVLACHLTVFFQFVFPPLMMPKQITPVPTLKELKKQKQVNMHFWGDNSYVDAAASFIAAPVLNHMKDHLLEPSLARIYRQAYYATNRSEVEQALRQSLAPDRLILENVPFKNRLPALAKNSKPSYGQVKLVYSSYNRLSFKVTSAHPAFLVLSYPYQSHWQAWRNNQQLPIYRANGLAQAVRIPAGKSTVEFRYWSKAAFWGMVISCLTMVGLFFLIARRSSRCASIRYLVGTSGFLLPALVFGLWYHSLYTGQNFHTRYEWQGLVAGTPTPRNIAYGKPTAISSVPASIFVEGYEYVYDGKRVVDGDRSFNSCCLTQHQNRPWWAIDLTKPERVTSIKIYAGLEGYEFDKLMRSFGDNIIFQTIYGKPILNKKPVLFNNPPLLIAVSRDGKNWDYSKANNVIGTDGTLHLKLTPPQTFRYLKIMATGHGRLCLNEVEIFQSP